jgi:hypothetical protein
MKKQDSAAIEARLDRIERVIERLVGRTDPVVDPSPVDWGRHFYQRQWPWIVDPAPFDWGRFPIRTPWPWPDPIVDPAPMDYLRQRLIDQYRIKDLQERMPGGGVTDPSPEDLARLTVTELQAQLHRIKAEKLRLDSFETILNERLDSLKNA